MKTQRRKGAQAMGSRRCLLLEVGGEGRRGWKRGGFSERSAQSSAAWTHAGACYFKWREEGKGMRARMS